MHWYVIVAAAVFAACPAAADTTDGAAATLPDQRLDLQVPERVTRDRDTSDVAFSLRHPGQQVEFFVNIGKVRSTAAPRADGRLAATFEFPEQRFPQVAVIVAASLDRSLIQWRTLAIDAKPTVALSSEPYAEVTVEVGGRSFGPIRTDSRGKGTMEIVVPAGTTAAQVHAIDRLGNRSDSELPLPSPDYQRLTLLCPTGSSRIFAFAVDAAGRPLEDGTIVLSSALGSMTPATALAPGVYAAELTVKGDTGGRTSVEITGYIESASDHVSKCMARIPPSAPTGLAIALDRESVARDMRRVEAIIEVRFPEGRIPAAVTPSVDVDFGVVSPLEPVGTHKYRASWVLPEVFGDRTQATLTARAGDRSKSSVVALDHRRLQPPWTVGAQVGYLTNLDAVSAPLVELLGYYRLPYWNERVLTGIGVGFYFSKTTETTADGMDESEARTIALPIVLRAEYEHPLGAWRLYGGAGAGVLFGEIAATGTTAESAPESLTLPVFGGALGARIPLGPGRATVEVGYWYSKVSTAFLRGNVTGARLSAGYAFEIQ